MDKLKMYSPNFAEENIAKIAALFSNCVTVSTDKDGSLKKSIDFDLLRQELSTHIVEGPQERYHLNWPGKRKALFTANAPIAKTFRPCREESVDFDTTENLFIEGDNLDALKLLQETYLGKVKMIYIDPPYNTGNDFIYADNFAESTEEYLLESGQKDEAGNRLVANTDSNGRFHSDWLSMMYPRLKLAKNLLKDDGVCLISIDDNELQNLRLLMNEIFGEKNFIGCFVWRRRVGSSLSSSWLSTDHEYVLAYGKYSEQVVILGDERDMSKYNIPDGTGRHYASMPLTVGMNRNMRPNQWYELKHPITGNGYWPAENRVWAYYPPTMNKKIKECKIIWPDDFPDRQLTTPRLKSYPEDAKRERKPLSTWINEKGMGKIDSKDSVSIFSAKNEEGTRVLKELIGESSFVYPKPMSLISNLIEQFMKEGDTALDFFSGSCTTAHAILELNQKQEYNRKYIMIQLPEKIDEKSEAFKAGYKTIAEIGKERIRRAGKKIKEENATNAPNLDIGFRVLKVDSSNMADVYYTPDKTKQTKLFKNTDNIKNDRTAEDLLFQVLLDLSIGLTLPITKETIADLDVFFVDGNALAACLVKNGDITEDFCKELAKREPLRVVFLDSGFADDAAKINVGQIFKLLSPHTDVKTI
jgi:adenine-specific DNA-methyltransferase